MSGHLERLAALQEQLIELLSTGVEGEAREALLRERASRYAEAERDALELDAEGAEVVVVRRASARLALPIESLVVVGSAHVTLLPQATDVVVGLFLMRGRAHCLIDPVALVDGPSVEPLPNRSLVALLQHGRRTLGLRLDEVLGPRHLVDADYDGSSRTQLSPCVQGLTRDGVVVLDPERLFASPEVVIDRAG